MRDLVQAYIVGRLDRRGFLKGMAASGFTAAAAESVLATLAPMVSAQAAQGDIRTVEGTGAYLLIQQLKAAGVKHVFYGNGTSSAAMLDVMVDDKDISLILGPEEGIVTAMASGYALASNEPTFVNVHGTVGTANQMLNMFNAKRDGDPLVGRGETDPVQLAVHLGQDVGPAECGPTFSDALHRHARCVGQDAIG